MIANFDSTRSTVTNIGDIPSLPRDGFAGFSRLYGGTPVEVTGRNAQIVDRIELSKIGSWYEAPTGAITESAALFGHVVHWPIKDAVAPDSLTHAFATIQEKLTVAQPETACVLDRLPPDYSPDYCWVIFGPSQSVVPVHQDMMGTASWNYLVSGQKTWTMWPPDAEPNASEPSHTFTQNPGDIVWIPEGCWHSVTYSASSICLSKNLVPARSLDKIQLAACTNSPRLYALLHVLKEVS